MNTLLIYAVKAAVYLIAFYLVYSLMLSRDTSYGRNRIFIIISLMAAMIFPFLTFHTIKPMDIQFFGKFLSEVFISADANGAGKLNSGSLISDPVQIIYSVYLFGFIVSLFKFLADMLNLLFLIIRKKTRGSHIIRFHSFNTSGFSAMGHIFINEKLSEDEAREIIKHEQNHLHQNHFLDIIFIELVKAFQWFNPAIYLLNRSLREIHEYQADHFCICSGIPVINYQNLLLNQVFKSRVFNLTNSFSNPSLIKKRMIMMTKKPTSAIASMKLLVVIPVTLLIFLTISAYKESPQTNQQMLSDETSTQLQQNLQSDSKIRSQASSVDESSTFVPPPPPPPPPDETKSDYSPGETETEPFTVVEEMPMFPGGDEELLKFIGENTQYPVAAKEKSIQGRVVVRFCVTSTGGVSQISVLKGVDPELDREAVRVVKSLPEFKPGKQGGKPVPVWYMVPITFTLR